MKVLLKFFVIVISLSGNTSRKSILMKKIQSVVDHLPPIYFSTVDPTKVHRIMNHRVLFSPNKYQKFKYVSKPYNYSFVLTTLQTVGNETLVRVPAEEQNTLTAAPDSESAYYVLDDFDDLDDGFLAHHADNGTSLASKYLSTATTSSEEVTYIITPKSYTLRAPSKSDVARLLTNTPQWQRYSLMMRNVRGKSITVNPLGALERLHSNSSSKDRYKFPESRDRWWWETGRHALHYWVWHCAHWMEYWKLSPPTTVLRGSPSQKFNKKDLLIHWYYRGNRETYFYKYCFWLLQMKPVSSKLTLNATNKGQRPKKRRQGLLRSNRKLMARCYFCNMHTLMKWDYGFLQGWGRGHYDDMQHEGLPTARLCHRAFHNPNYSMYKHLMVARCFYFEDHRSGYEQRYGYFGIKAGYSTIRGVFHRNSCISITTDVGELYDVRGCRFNFTDTYGALGGDLIHQPLEYTGPISDVLYAMNYENVEGCWSTPYSVLVPYLRAKVGLYVRFRYCVCRGYLCNSSVTVSVSNVFAYLMILYHNLSF